MDGVSTTRCWAPDSPWQEDVAVLCSATIDNRQLLHFLCGCIIVRLFLQTDVDAVSWVMSTTLQNKKRKEGEKWWHHCFTRIRVRLRVRFNSCCIHTLFLGVLYRGYYTRPHLKASNYHNAGAADGWEVTRKRN